jgi:nicotinamidase-related amidase
MRDALLAIDVFRRFEHEDGPALLASLERRLPGPEGALGRARADGVPVLYVNDAAGRWDSNAQALVEDALAAAGGAALRPLVPQRGEVFLLKPRNSVFDHTPLELLLRDLETERVLLAGAATEMCVVQSAIDARDRGLKVTILADACATTHEELERLSPEYAERVVGARVERG